MPRATANDKREPKICSIFYANRGHTESIEKY